MDSFLLTIAHMPHANLPTCTLSIYIYIYPLNSTIRGGSLRGSGTSRTWGFSIINQSINQCNNKLDTPYTSFSQFFLLSPNFTHDTWLHALRRYSRVSFIVFLKFALFSSLVSYVEYIYVCVCVYTFT